MTIRFFHNNREMMDWIIKVSDFISKTHFGTLSGYLIGVIGTILTIYSVIKEWRNSRQDKAEKKRYEYLFELAERNINKNISEEEISKKRQQIEQMSTEIVELQIQNEREVPNEAKRAVLKDRLNSAIEELTKYYKDVQSLREQLGSLDEPNQLSEDILNKIESEIQPKFLLKEEISNLKSIITIFTT